MNNYIIITTTPSCKIGYFRAIGNAQSIANIILRKCADLAPNGTVESRMVNGEVNFRLTDGYKEWIFRAIKYENLPEAK